MYKYMNFIMNKYYHWNMLEDYSLYKLITQKVIFYSSLSEEQPKSVPVRFL